MLSLQSDATHPIAPDHVLEITLGSELPIKIVGRSWFIEEDCLVICVDEWDQTYAIYPLNSVLKITYRRNKPAYEIPKPLI